MKIDLIRSGFWFLSVGAAAGLAHVIAFFLISHLFPLILLELVNFFAFCIAFSVSFIGHRNLSFSDTTASVKKSISRFIFVSTAGFISNEVIFSVLLRVVEWPSWLALFFGFAVAGGQTYLLSRYWAFHRK
jgi:putative flippase GtrA